jgi:flagellar protein FliL
VAEEDKQLEAPEGEVDGGEGKKKKGKSSLLLIILLPILTLVLAGGGAYFAGILKFGDEPKHEEENAESHKEGESNSTEKSDPEGLITENQNKPKQTVFFNLPDLMVNLNGAQDQVRYLKLKVSFEMADQANISGIEPLMPKILDTIQVYIRGLRVSDLKDNLGVEKLRQELLKRINLITGDNEVFDIWFPEMLTQ